MGSVSSTTTAPRSAYLGQNQDRPATRDHRATPAFRDHKESRDPMVTQDRRETPARQATLDLLDLMAVRGHLARRAIRVQSVNRVRQAMLAQLERQATLDP
jgi:hypothetical protein